MYLRTRGCEPEAIAYDVVAGSAYAFVGLERSCGVMVYDSSDATAPVFVSYLNDRDLNAHPESGNAGERGPEGIVFVPAADSPDRTALLAVGNQVSGSTTRYRPRAR